LPAGGFQPLSEPAFSAIQRKLAAYVPGIKIHGAVPARSTRRATGYAANEIPRSYPARDAWREYNR